MRRGRDEGEHCRGGAARAQPGGKPHRHGQDPWRRRRRQTHCCWRSIMNEQPTMTAETLANASDAETWELRLYVAGSTPKCLAAFARLKKMCEENIPGRYRIEVIDLLERPQLAEGDEIVAIPTLVRKLPPPLRKIIGDLSDTERTLVGLQIRPLAAGKERAP